MNQVLNSLGVPDARLGEVAAEYDRLLEDYRFSDAVGLLYNFAWSEVFDWYLEMAKTSLRNPESAEATKQTLGVVIRDLLALFHPVIPYVTEELWSELVEEGLVAAASAFAPAGPSPVLRRAGAARAVSQRPSVSMKVRS